MIGSYLEAELGLLIGDCLGIGPDLLDSVEVWFEVGMLIIVLGDRLLFSWMLGLLIGLLLLLSLLFRFILVVKSFPALKSNSLSNKSV